MAKEQNLKTISVVAGSDLSGDQYHAVQLNGENSMGLCGAGYAMLGVLQDHPASGQVGTVAYEGVTKAVAGTGGVSAGSGVRVVADGFTNTDGTHPNVGIALTSATAGQYFDLLIRDNQGLLSFND